MRRQLVWGTLLLMIGGMSALGCQECEPGHIVTCDCGEGARGQAVCMDDGSWTDCSCPICEPGATQACTCSQGIAGTESCTENGLDWGSCECSPCAEYVDTICSCEGVEDYYEAIGTTCVDTYQPLIEEGDPDACELALDAFEAAGGCDQFDLPGDDDDDDIGDDDDVPPAYQGDIQMADALVYGECTATVEVDPAHPENVPEGWFEFEIELAGWAMDCWINFWDHLSDYCEAYDPDTGDPCESDGYTRPGWDMTNDAYGWDPVYGFWDYWTAYIEYFQDLATASAQGESVFVCENAGVDFTTEFCCQDDYTEVLYCREYSW